MTPPDHCKNCLAPIFFHATGHTEEHLREFCLECRDTRPHPKKRDNGER